MRREFPLLVESSRELCGPFRSNPGDRYGAFVIPRNGHGLRVIASDGSDWVESGLPLPVFEHVSVSLVNRIPIWVEMQFVKELFWGEEELVLQYHVPRVAHVNLHENVLHLWKPVGVDVVLPPLSCV